MFNAPNKHKQTKNKQNIFSLFLLCSLILLNIFFSTFPTPPLRSQSSEIQPRLNPALAKCICKSRPWEPRLPGLALAPKRRITNREKAIRFLALQTVALRTTRDWTARSESFANNSKCLMQCHMQRHLLLSYVIKCGSQ